MTTFLAVAWAWRSVQIFRFFSPACASCGISLGPIQHHTASADRAPKMSWGYCQATLPAAHQAAATQTAPVLASLSLRPASVSEAKTSTAVKILGCGERMLRNLKF